MGEVKKTSTSTSSSSVYQWEDDSGTWTNYDEDVQELIRDAAAYGASQDRDPPPVSARIGSQYYAIYIAIVEGSVGALQVNTSTGVERPVRYVHKPSAFASVIDGP